MEVRGGTTAGASGSRSVDSGALGNEGSSGYCWSATPSDALYGSALHFHSAVVYAWGFSVLRGFGYPLRCIQEFTLCVADSSVRVKMQEDATVRASGNRSVGSGTMSGAGNYGYSWSTSPSGATGGLLMFSVWGSLDPQSNYDRGFGYPLRCIQGFTLHGTDRMKPDSPQHARKTS